MQERVDVCTRVHVWVGVGVGLFKLMVLIRKLIQLRLARVKTVKLTYVEYTRVAHFQKYT